MKERTNLIFCLYCSSGGDLVYFLNQTRVSTYCLVQSLPDFSISILCRFVMCALVKRWCHRDRFSSGRQVRIKLMVLCKPPERLTLCKDNCHRLSGFYSSKTYVGVVILVSPQQNIESVFQKTVCVCFIVFTFGRTWSGEAFIVTKQKARLLCGKLFNCSIDYKNCNEKQDSNF